jgi:ferredoxin
MKIKFPTPVKASTLAFFRSARRTPGYSLWNWLHGYVYGRWTYLYIGLGIGEHPLSGKVARLAALSQALVRPFASLRARLHPDTDQQTTDSSTNRRTTHTWADTYHGKVVSLAAAQQLVLVNEDIRLPDLEQVIPYERARDLILLNPDHLVALDCPCRSARANPCLPLDVCLIVGEPFASFVVDHHPGRSRWISREEAVGILQAEDERGHVHHAFFKDAMLNRFYAICNCCACCCGAMQAHQHGTPMLASSGYVAQVDQDLCLGCGECVDFCQFGALAVDGYYAEVDEVACMGCGVCLSKCQQGALALRREPGRGEPLEMCALMDAALSG